MPCPPRILWRSMKRLALSIGMIVGLAPSARFNFQMDLVRSLYVILPGAILWGASFPVALAAASGGATDPGRTVGRVYAANTLGAIGGSLLTGLVFVPWIGTKGAQQVLIAVSVVSGMLAIVPLIRPASSTDSAPAWRRVARRWHRTRSAS